MTGARLDYRAANYAKVYGKSQTRSTRGKQHNIKEGKYTRASKGNEDKTKAKEEDVTKGNKEVGSQELMIDTNKDKAMC